MKKKVLAIIPAYNEAANIEAVVKDIKKNAPGIDYIIVNDGSKDNTLEILKKNKYNYIDSVINLGLFGAVQTGFLYALENDYDIAIQFDGDGQHKAKYIKDLVKETSEGNNIVIGSRFISKKKPKSMRMLGSNFITLAILLATGKKIKDPTSGFRAYDKSVYKMYALDPNSPPEPDTLVYMLKLKKRVKEVAVSMDERQAGESYLNFYNSIKYMTRMIVSIFFIQTFRKR